MCFFPNKSKIFCLLLVCLALSLPGFTAAVPVISDNGKKPIHASAVPQAAHGAQTLGKYNDISAVKKNRKPGASRSASAKTAVNISAKSAIIIDAVTGKTLFARSPDIPRQPASTIKILTGMIALKSLETNEPVSVSPKAARQPRSKIYLDHRKQYQANDLINAVLLASANDASVALAEKIAGSEQSFAKMMTLRARLWGAEKTVCKTASGLTAEGQTSTARDLATIFRHAMNDNDFASRMKRTNTRTTDGKLLHNHNKALWQVEGTQGGKTGYTNAARQTYVGKFKRGKDEIIVAIMGSEMMWADIKKLVDYGFRQKKLLSQNQPRSADSLVAASQP